MDLNDFFDKQSTKKEAIKLLFGKDANADDKQQSEQLFPDLRKKAAKERAKLAYLPCPKHQDSNFNSNPNKIEGLRLLSSVSS